MSLSQPLGSLWMPPPCLEVGEKLKAISMGRRPGYPSEAMTVLGRMRSKPERLSRSGGLM